MSCLTVRDVMREDVPTLFPQASAEAARALMRARGVAGCAVIAEDAHPIGVVEWCDVAGPAHACERPEVYPRFYRTSDLALGDDEGEDLHGTVGDAMSPFVLSIEPSARIAEAARRMIAEGVFRLLVSDGTRLVGSVSGTDLLRGFVLERGTAGVSGARPAGAAPGSGGETRAGA